MSENLAEQAAGIGALADAVRRDLYEYVVAQVQPVGREEAATAVDVPLHMAKFHLDRLVQEGLLETEFRRLSGRSGPGAGRPAKLYKRSSREWSVSLPARNYGLMAHILVAGVEQAAAQGQPIDESLRRAAAEEGTRAAESVPADERATSPRDIAALSNALARYGYEPRTGADEELLLVNCPFEALARSHTTLVCGLNLSFVEALTEGLGCSEVDARLEPHDAYCCVRGRTR